MDASSLSSLQTSLPLSIKKLQKHKVGHLSGLKRLQPSCCARGKAGSDQGDWNYGQSVDEDMLVLRMRIHEMKMAERNYQPPVEWMDWEKRYYAHYDSDICEALGLLQNLLMNSRPSLAIGMVALLAISVPTSMFMLLFHFIDAAKHIL